MDIEETKEIWLKIISDEEMQNGSIKKTYKSYNSNKVLVDDIPNSSNSVDPLKEEPKENSVNQIPEERARISSAQTDINSSENDIPTDNTTERAVAFSTEDFSEIENRKESLILWKINSTFRFLGNYFRFLDKKFKIKSSYVLVTVTFLIIFLIYNSLQQGKITTAHNIASMRVNPENSCSTCHQGQGISNTERCIRCHQQETDIRGEESSSAALNIHGLSQNHWKKYGLNDKKVEEFRFSQTLSQAKKNLDNAVSPQIACSSCHKEHQGRNFNLSVVDNNSCQICHNQSSSDFWKGHPNFDNYPHKKGTHIYFNHTNHFEEYFEDRSRSSTAPHNCNACHELDKSEQAMLTKNFEEACNQCHQTNILKEDEDIAVIRFPGFLTEKFYLQSKQFEVRPKFTHWPSIDKEDTGEATDFMRLLLSKDKELSDDDISKYLDTFLYDHIADSPTNGKKNEIKAINAYIMMIQRLCDEITSENTLALKRRLEKILHVSIKSETIKNLFPNVAEFLQVIQSRVFPPINTQDSKRFNNFEFKDENSPTGWYFRNYTLHYRPSRHKDPVMKAWLDLMVRSYNTDKPDSEGEVEGNTHYVLNAVNRCLKCHTIDKVESKDAAWEINWESSKTKPKVQFTRFSHREHILAEMDCSSCHILKKQDPVGGNNKFFDENYDRKKLISFRSISKDLCSSCHNRNVANEKCTTCHNYHARSFKTDPYGSIRYMVDQYKNEMANTKSVVDQHENDVVQKSRKRKADIQVVQKNQATTSKSKIEKTQEKTTKVFLSKQETQQQIKRISAIKKRPVDIKKIVTAKKCGFCHTQEAQVWKKTPHYKTFAEMEKRPRAKNIFQKLGGKGSIKKSGRCDKCHYTQQGGTNKVVSGVSCELCHGAGKDWILVHNDKTVAKITRRQKSIDKGMNNPVDIYSIAQTCYDCHSVPDEELVNVGGHKAGSAFELVSWSQGTERHNFVTANNKENAVSSKERLRVMFITGLMLDLEYALRGLAKATKPGKYYETMLSKVNRTYKILKAANSKSGGIKEIQELLALFAKLNMKNRNHLETSANWITLKARQFVGNNDGSKLGFLDAFIPKHYK
ncbi:multiheme c-type cytochrome [Candidatus Uabimicrobium amorphum]|uniref:Cytochrome c554 n=1 Tax=Uabimicrobium amorphum TaxID=2596890 RepID=A0A5S9IQY3_UABAM|nr:multiheme c-type cytochrome [Candidatus Uabimicrobium amorphum]BBM86274.1 cytochrome c554 [Candidatus Uabimicrobium amorphum]